MKNIIIISLVLLLTSCNGYIINGAGFREYRAGPDSSWANNYRTKPEYQHTEFGTRYRYYIINGHYYQWQNEGTWKEHQLNRYDRLWAEAEKKGYNSHWYIDKYFNEDEARTKN
jgi:hypothetical protein